MIIPPLTYRADYANAQQLGPIETFSRTSVATQVNDLGSMAPVGISVPRFDFDPVTLACRGLLVEPQTTNLVTYSEFPNGLADAQAIAGQVAASTFPGFAGGLSFPGLAQDTYAYKRFDTVAGEIYSFSVFVRMNDGSAPTIVSASGPAAGNDFALIIFNLAGTAMKPIVTDMGGGLYRVSVSGVRPPDGSGGVNQFQWFGVCRYSSNRTRPFRVTGYQLEKNTGRLADTDGTTSYVPTTSAAVTRAADYINVSSSNVTKVLRLDQGVMRVKVRIGGFSGVNQVAMSLSDGTQNNRIVLYRNNLLQMCALCLIDNSAIFNTPISGVTAPGDVLDLAISFQRGRWVASCNGVGFNLSTSTSMPVVNVLHIGHGFAFIPWHGHIMAWETKARSMSLAEVTELTKPI